MKDSYNNSISKTDIIFFDWCETNGIPIFKIHHVVTWEDWDNGIGIYFFTKTNRELKDLSEVEMEELKMKYLEFLNINNYPFSKFPNVVFEFDSDQNVTENYEGNYFYRLR
ncbi:hypothetical protein SAMN05421739_108112 [Pontibacter chinhatensis]|uniref:Uncharacterized protein n=2 Tax=Pontibacter chinhatensis TaxID=1436961 RepID=A0A1I2YL68_9BACT|nr:hypothetical protein SAMN05421739_108112 [Pontibacter chinhatensis]